VIFEAGAYIWWAAAKDSDAFEAPRIDSSWARHRGAPAPPGPAAQFWLATALGYRARERDLRAARGAPPRRARDAGGLPPPSRRLDVCRLLPRSGLYRYGLARATTLARIVAKLIGLGSGKPEEGIRYMRRVGTTATWRRSRARGCSRRRWCAEAARDPAGAGALVHEARSYVDRLAHRYPDNAVFQRFLLHYSERAP